MKIIYDQNPLKTKIFLDDNEKFKFLHNILKNLMTWNTNLNQIEDIEKRMNDDFETLILELENGIHSGDCTCIPMSCLKCEAEGYAEVNTLQNLTKNMASHLVDAFFPNDCENNIDQAIEYLKIPIPEKPNKVWENNPWGWSNNRVRWNIERTNALNWLLDYKNSHFGDI